MLRQFLIGRASAAQLVAQFPRVLRAFPEFSHLKDHIACCADLAVHRGDYASIAVARSTNQK